MCLPAPVPPGGTASGRALDARWAGRWNCFFLQTRTCGPRASAWSPAAAWSTSWTYPAGACGWGAGVGRGWGTRPRRSAERGTELCAVWVDRCLPRRHPIDGEAETESRSLCQVRGGAGPASPSDPQAGAPSAPPQPTQVQRAGPAWPRLTVLGSCCPWRSLRPVSPSPSCGVSAVGFFP